MRKRSYQQGTDGKDFITRTKEANFDGLVGPTHNYAGLSYGNIASTQNQKFESSPKQAALQGLAKMKFMHEMGFLQGVIPPQERPYMPILVERGFKGGSRRRLLASVLKKNPLLLAQVSSASSMWTANAATVSPSADTKDGKIHFTPANLISHFHRSLEPPVTSRVLRAIFRHPKYFVHHDPLPAEKRWGDEGAANHTRLCKDYGDEGLEIFVYGVQGSREGRADQNVLPEPGTATPQLYPARQTRRASQKIADTHGVKQAILVQQNPAVIDKGVFHNDVIAVGNRNRFFFHEHAFLEKEKLLKKVRSFLGDDLRMLEVKDYEVSVEDAVRSYLFNSQLVTDSQENTILIAPEECNEIPPVRRFLSKICGQREFIQRIYYKDVKQSMRNGGGPACLRLRVVLTHEERLAVNRHCFYSPQLHEKLERVIHKYYRDTLTPEDLADPDLLKESLRALDEISQILDLGSIYDFQRNSSQESLSLS